MPEKRERESERVKTAIASYFRYVRQYPIVAIEAKARLLNVKHSDRADILVVDKNQILTEIEIKTSISDLEGDTRKHIHKDLESRRGVYPVHYFYFGIPSKIEKEARQIIKKEYPYAGLIVVDGHYKLTEPLVRIPIEARRFFKDPLNPAEMHYILKAMSSAVCRMSFSRLAQNRGNQIPDIRDDGEYEEENKLG